MKDNKNVQALTLDDLEQVSGGTGALIDVTQIKVQNAGEPVFKDVALVSGEPVFKDVALVSGEPVFKDVVLESGEPVFKPVTVQEIKTLKLHSY